jgi:hypothetical protein
VAYSFPKRRPRVNGLEDAGLAAAPPHAGIAIAIGISPLTPLRAAETARAGATHGGTRP